MPRRNFINHIEEWNTERILFVLGTTGSGKSSKTFNELRRRALVGEKSLLLSLDSVACYKYLDIASAKPNSREQQEFQIGGINIVEPHEKITVGLYLSDIKPRVQAAKESKMPIVFVGGSHFYEKAIVDGLSPGEASDETYQKSLEAEALCDLYKRLCQLAPSLKDKVNVTDRYRIQRYLDLIERQGIAYETLVDETSRRSLFPNETVDVFICGLNVELKAYEEILNQRIGEMFNQGFIEELETLVQRFGLNAPALESVGYKQGVEWIKTGANKSSLSDLKEQMLIAHRQLGKKQRTWLRGLLNSAL